MIRPLQDSAAARSVNVPPTSIPTRSAPVAEWLKCKVISVVCDVAIFVSGRRRRNHRTLKLKVVVLMPASAARLKADIVATVGGITVVERNGQRRHPPTVKGTGR